MAVQCKECGGRLGVFEKMLGECHECHQKRRIAEQVAAETDRAKRWEEQKKRWPWRMFSQSITTDSSPQKYEQIVREESWVEIMLTLTWTLCFGAAAVFGLIALSATAREEQGSAVIFTAYATSLMVLGVIFASIGKIISTLTSVNNNLSVLVSQAASDVQQRKDSSETKNSSEPVN